MPYLIDGHNLIGQLPDISLTDPNDEAKLVEKLRGFAARSGKKCVVIFDNGLPAGKSKMSNNAVQVTFAARPGEADDLLVRRIRQAKNPGGWTVVSSDNRVLEEATRKGMKSLRAKLFAEKLKHPAPIPKEENPHVYVSATEVDEWLEIFTNRDNHKK